MEKNIRKNINEIKPYVPGKPISEVKRDLGLRKVIKLASNESPYPPFPEAVEVINKQAQQVRLYPDSGCWELREKLAGFLKVEPKNVAVGHGSNELVRLLANIFLEPGDEIVTGWPSFIVFPTVAQLMEGKLIKVPLKEHRFDLLRVLEKVGERTKIIFIPNPNNPTGTIVYKNEVDDFLDKLPEQVAVVFDEAYFEYVDDERYPDSLDCFRKKRNVCILRTFSKIYSLAGLRIGYGIMPEVVANAINKAREPFNVNTLAQAAAIASLDCQDEVRKRRELNKEGKKFLCGVLNKMGLAYVPSQANFVLVDVGRNSREVFRQLINRGVIIRTGDIFGTEYENFIRVTIGTMEENKNFIEALSEILV